VPDHDRFRAMAEDPSAVRIPRDIWAFREHLRQCVTCSERFQQALDCDNRLGGPIRQNWRHVSNATIKKLASSGFQPDGRTFQTQEEWHVTVCPQCGTRLRQQLDQHGEVRHVGPRFPWAVASLLVLLVASAAWYLIHNGNSDTAEMALRSSAGIDLTRPTDGSNIHVLQEFRWQPVSSISEYDLVVSDSTDGHVVLRAEMTQPLYLLNPEDAGKLVVGREYRWMVAGRFANTTFRSSSWRFRFSGAQVSTSP
jgi:hypothetical protein